MPQRKTPKQMNGSLFLGYRTLCSAQANKFSQKSLLFLSKRSSGRITLFKLCLTRSQEGIKLNLSLQLEGSKTKASEPALQCIRPSFVNSFDVERTIGSKEGPENPRWIYFTYCASCHEAGVYGAPTRGNIEAWENFPRDLDELLDLTKMGKGAMISKGGCEVEADTNMRCFQA